MSDIDKARGLVDAEKLREIIHKNTFHGVVMDHRREAIVEEIESLLIPSLPTLAELIDRGNDPQQYQWMQADHIEQGRVIITHPGSTYIYYMKTSGLSGGVSHSGAYRITPRPDLPRLEWPAQEPRNPETLPAETLNNTSSDTPRNPRPEDVPAGEPWLVMNEGCRGQWVGTRDDSGTTNWPWILVKIDGVDYAFSEDVEVTLISRLVTEVKP